MTEPAYKYSEEHSLPEAEGLAWIRRQTNLHTNFAHMLSGPLQGSFITMMTRLCNVRRALEIGTFTGYTSVCIARGLAEGGHLDTLEKNDELVDIILEGWERCGVRDRITLHSGDALALLADMALQSSQSGIGDGRAPSPCLSTGSGRAPLLRSPEIRGKARSATGALPMEALQSYDLVYIDADKREYRKYLEAVLPLVRPGGLIMADNTLWGGKILEDPMPVDRQTREIHAFNELAAGDPRIETILLPLRDGISLIRKK